MAIVNNAAMNIGVHVSLQIRVFIFYRYILRSGIARWYGYSIFSFLRTSVLLRDALLIHASTWVNFLCVCVCVCVWSVAQSYATLCGPMDCHPPGSSAHGVFRAGILEYGAISYSRGSSQPRDPTHVSSLSCIGKRILYRYKMFRELC